MDLQWEPSPNIQTDQVTGDASPDLDISGKRDTVLQVLTAPCFKANSGVQRKDVL